MKISKSLLAGFLLVMMGTSIASARRGTNSNFVMLAEAMLRHGFKPVSTEWWHFTLKNEPYSNTFFTFSVQE
jgi:D-alanyl-D-alanine dipeptidase